MFVLCVDLGRSGCCACGLLYIFYRDLGGRVRLLSAFVGCLADGSGDLVSDAIVFGFGRDEGGGDGEVVKFKKHITARRGSPLLVALDQMSEL